MTANHEHTLKTAQVRFAATFPNENFSLKGTDFDRWLAARDARIIAAAEQRGAVKALRSAAQFFSDPGGERFASWAAVQQYLNDRADQMEADDE